MRRKEGNISQGGVENYFWIIDGFMGLTVLIRYNGASDKRKVRAGFYGK
jgi:hypothetical protein